MLNRRIEFCLREILSSKNNPTISIHITPSVAVTPFFQGKERQAIKQE